jgi:hypothetical protein
VEKPGQFSAKINTILLRSNEQVPKIGEVEPDLRVFKWHTTLVT